MKRYTTASMLLVLLVIANTSEASPLVEKLLDEYRQQGVTQADAKAGRQFWNQAFTPKAGNEPRRCNSCHSDDPRRAGRHVTTHKPIAALAPSVNPERLTDAKKVRKWLKRNCKWTVGRECTAQEQANVLLYLKDL